MRNRHEQVHCNRRPHPDKQRNDAKPENINRNTQSERGYTDDKKNALTQAEMEILSIPPVFEGFQCLFGIYIEKRFAQNWSKSNNLLLKNQSFS